MTTQQQQPTEQPTPEPQPPLLELALRVGRLEGLVEMLVEQQRALGERMDRLTLAVLAGAIVLAAAIIGTGFFD